MQDKKRIVSEAALLAVITGMVTFGCFVWPTPWVYVTVTPVWSGLLPGPREYQGKFVTEYRTNRVNGEAQAKMGNHWEHVFETM